MKNQSTLVQGLAIVNQKELNVLTEESSFDLKQVAYLVVIKGYTYEIAGKSVGISKAAVYKFLKKLYKKKYGIEYHGTNHSNPEND